MLTCRERPVSEDLKETNDCECVRGDSSSTRALVASLERGSCSIRFDTRVSICTGSTALRLLKGLN